MKKSRLFLLLTALLLCAVLALSLTACGDDECKHSYIDSVTTEPGCESEGVRTYVCTSCGDSYTEKIAALGHTYSEELVFNSTHHYYECECGSRKDEEKHISSGAPTADKDEVCTVCGYVINKAGIKFNTLNVTGNTVYGKVSNDTEFFSFINEVTSVGGAKYIVSLNIIGSQPVYTKTIDLKEGDNTVYIIELIDDEPTNIYTVTIRRRPMYEVVYDANGGTSVDSVWVEEGGLTVEPSTTRNGYTFVSWDYDFTTPITKNTHITANWKAHTNTAYKVEYYLENLTKYVYELVGTDELTGTTDTTAKALIKEFEHFTFDSEKSVTSGNIKGNGNLVLKVYYTRNGYSLSTNDSYAGSITNAGTYTYGVEEFTTTATLNVGYEFIGWYSDEELLSTDLTYTFTATQNVTAKFAVKADMSNFYFTSTATTCYIRGIKDKTVTNIIIPEGVTSIGGGAFKDCSSLTSVTIGSGVTSIDDNAFSYCTSLTSIVIPDGVTCIGPDAFWGCSSLTSVTIGNGVTGIGNSAFRYCSSLTSVTIGNGVTGIGNSAFGYCPSLTSIKYRGTEAQWNAISKGFYWNDNTGSCTITYNYDGE